MAPEIAYVADKDAAYKTILVIEDYEERLAHWQQAYDDLHAQTTEYQRSMESQWARVLEDIEVMKMEHDEEVRRLNLNHAQEIRSVKSKSRRPGFGVFAGVGIVPGGFEPVIGAGIVWRLF